MRSDILRGISGSDNHWQYDVIIVWVNQIDLSDHIKKIDESIQEDHGLHLLKDEKDC
jgi:hypothetical protein